MEKIIDKVKKLLRLAENNQNTHEAQSAMVLAQKLMAEHHLTQSQVESEASDVIEMAVLEGKRRVQWKTMLAAIIADNFRCCSYNQIDRRQGTFTIKYVGLNEDIEIAKAIYQGALRTIEKSWARYRKRLQKATSSQANTFRLGFIGGLNALYKEQKAANKEWALVLVTPKKVVDHIDSMDMKAAPKTSKANYSLDAAILNAGQQTGRAFGRQRTLEGTV